MKTAENDILEESDDEKEEPNSVISISQTPRLSRTSSVTGTPNVRRNSSISSQTPPAPPRRQSQAQSQRRQSQAPKRQRQKLKICFQFHGHRKKNCMIKDQFKNDICKYNFPRPIMAVTTVIEPFVKEDDISRKLFDVYYKMWINIRESSYIALRDYFM